MELLALRKGQVTRFSQWSPAYSHSSTSALTQLLSAMTKQRRSQPLPWQIVAVMKTMLSSTSARFSRKSNASYDRTNRSLSDQMLPWEEISRWDRLSAPTVQRGALSTTAIHNRQTKCEMIFCRKLVKTSQREAFIQSTQIRSTSRIAS